MASVHQRATAAAANVTHDRADQVWLEGALRLVFENSPDAALLIDGGVFVDCNRAALELLGFAGKPELLSHSPAALLLPIQSDGTNSGANADEMIATALS